jgi:hypothetical protein
MPMGDFDRGGVIPSIVDSAKTRGIGGRKNVKMTQ